MHFKRSKYVFLCAFFLKKKKLKKKIQRTLTTIKLCCFYRSTQRVNSVLMAGEKNTKEECMSLTIYI